MSTYQCAPDIFLPNDVYHFAMERPFPGRVLSAAVLVVSTADHRAGVAAALERLLEDVGRRLPDREARLVVVTHYKAPIGPVARHLALWRKLERDRIAVPNGARGREEMVPRPDGALFHAGLTLADTDPEEIARFMRATAPYLVLTRIGEELAGERTGAWLAGPRTQFLPKEAMTDICADGIVVIVPLGEYDDAEAGCIAFGRPDEIASLTGMPMFGEA